MYLCSYDSDGAKQQTHTQQQRGKSNRLAVEFPSMLQTGARGLMGKSSALDATDPGSVNSKENFLMGWNGVVSPPVRRL